MSPIEPDFSREQDAASAAHTVQKTKTLPVSVGLFRRVWARGTGTLRIFLDADGIRAGAATAFYGAFSVAPLLVILTSIAAWIWGDMANMSDERGAGVLDRVLANGGGGPERGARAPSGAGAHR